MLVVRAGEGDSTAGRSSETGGEDEAPQGAETPQGSSLNSPGKIELHGKMGSSTALLAAPLCVYMSFPQHLLLGASR